MRSKAIYAAVVVFVTIVAGFIGNILYTNRVDERADRRNQQRARDFCGVIVLIDDRYQKLPPSADPTARQFADAIHAYRLKLGC